MTINVIVASVLSAVQSAIEIKRRNTDPLDASNINWQDEARAILSGIPANKDVDLGGYLVANKGYSTDDLTAAGAIMNVFMGSNPELMTTLSDGGDLTPFASDAQADADIVKHIHSKLNLGQATASTNTSAAAQPATPSIAIDPGMEGAINALLTQATKGQLKSIGELLNANTALSGDLATARNDLTQALMKQRAVPIAATGTVAGPNGDLNYKVVYRKANDVFPIANGKPSGKGLAFDIPTLEWTDQNGAQFQHPETPDQDPNYDFDALKLLMFLTGINRGMNQWLFGHTGTGKTTFIEQAASRMGWPVSRINLDSNLERADLVGHITLTDRNGTTVSLFEEGILPRAMQRPGFLIMDEIDSGRPDILFVVQRALEGKGLMLTEDKGRIVAPHALFRFAATANTRGQGDEYGMYAGTRTMNASMIDRFTSFIQFDYMKPDRESALLRKLVPVLTQDMADKMANFALEVRTAFAKGEVYNTISPRGLTVLADCFATFTGLGTADNTAFQLAMDMSVLNKVTNDTRQKFIELASRVFGFKTK